MKILILLICLTPIFSYANWEILQTNESVTKRHENGFVSVNNKLVLIGGRKVKEVESLNLDTMLWEAETTLPIEMHHITPVVYKNTIWIVTGLKGNYPNEKPLEKIYTYNVNNRTWKEEMSIPKERRRGAAGVTINDGKIYIVGGIENGHTSGTSNFFDVYDIENNMWQTLENAPHIRDHNNVVFMNNKLIAMGGRNTSFHYPNNFTAFFKSVINEIDIYDIKKKTWKTLPTTLPRPAAGAGAISHNGHIYFIGGENEYKPALASVFRYNLDNNNWKEIAPLNVGRHGTNLVKHKGSLYIGAGSGRQGGSPELTSIEKLNLDKIK